MCVKSIELVRAESRFSAFFGYLPSVMKRVRKFRLKGYRFTLADNDGKGGFCIFVAKPKKCGQKHTLEKLSELLNVPISLDAIIRNVPAKFIVAMSGARIEHGKKITDAYQRGFGSSSCMTRENSSKTGIYAENPKHVGILLGENSFLADQFRAITWHDSRGIKVDRVYGNQSRTKLPYFVARHFADLQDLKLRTKNGTAFVDDNGKTIHARFILNWSSSDPMPYMDTLIYLSSYTAGTVTIQTRNKDAIKQLQSQDGEACDGTMPESENCCDSCGDSLNEEERYCADWISGTVCESCYSDATGYCEHCEESCWADDIRNIELQRNGRRPIERCFCEHCYQNEVTEIVGDLYALSDDCQELHDGQYALTEDCQELHDGQYALSDDVIEMHNGQYALRHMPSDRQLILY